MSAGLYLHIPFCHAKCAYCDFFSTPDSRMAADYVEALRKEYEARIAEMGSGTRFDTIYLGGGTPSSLTEPLLDRLMSWLPVADATEITIEVNPEDVTPRFARWLYASPVNRVSMGVQSLDDNELRFIGRRHSAADALSAYETLRSAGIDNISLDLIFGLPLQTVDSFISTLRHTLELQPDHLSAYALMLEPGTRLRAMAQAGRFEETPGELLDEMYRRLCEATRHAGFEHYEISNYARPGLRSRHNSSYWNLTPYLGLGTGAHSFDGLRRRYNPNDIRRYVAAPATFTQSDEETETERINDYVMIRLRTAEGLSLTDAAHRFGEVTARRILGNARHAIARGDVLHADSALTIAEEKLLVSDPIIADIML